MAAEPLRNLDVGLEAEDFPGGSSHPCRKKSEQADIRAEVVKDISWPNCFRYDCLTGFLGLAQPVILPGTGVKLEPDPLGRACFNLRPDFLLCGQNAIAQRVEETA